MNKKNAMQCELCTEPTKRMVFMDGLNCNSIGWMCDNIDCSHIDTEEKQNPNKQKRQEVQKINRDNGVDIRKLAKLRIRAQLNLVEAAEIVWVRTAQYSAWEREIEPITVDKYNALMGKYKYEISTHKCDNCRFYNGDESDLEAFCDKLEDETQRDCVCERHMKRWE